MQTPDYNHAAATFKVDDRIRNIPVMVHREESESSSHSSIIRGSLSTEIREGKQKQSKRIRQRTFRNRT